MNAIANMKILILVHKTICLYVPYELYQFTRINYQQYDDEYTYDTPYKKIKNKYDISAELKFKPNKWKCSCKKCKKKKHKHDKYCCEHAYKQACCQYPEEDTGIHGQYPYGDDNIHDPYPYGSSSIHDEFPYETTPKHDMFSTTTRFPYSPSFPYSPGSNFFNYLKKFPNIKDWYTFFPWMTTPRSKSSTDENGTGKDPSQDTGKDPGPDSQKDVGKDPGKDIGKDTEKDSGKDSGKDPSKDMDTDTGKDSGKDPSQDAGKDPSKDPGKDTGTNGDKDNATDADINKDKTKDITTISTLATDTDGVPIKLRLKKATQSRCLRNNCLQDDDKIGKYFYNDIIVRPTIGDYKRNFDPDYIVPIPDNLAMNIFNEMGVNN